MRSFLQLAFLGYPFFFSPPHSPSFFRTFPPRVLRISSADRSSFDSVGPRRVFLFQLLDGPLKLGRPTPLLDLLSPHRQETPFHCARAVPRIISLSWCPSLLLIPRYRGAIKSVSFGRSKPQKVSFPCLLQVLPDLASL